jgi:aspartyl aminopeptidase
VPAWDVAGYDLLTANTQAPARFGKDGELFAAGRMDNLSSVYAGLVALIAAADEAHADDHCSMCGKDFCAVRTSRRIRELVAAQEHA